MYPVNKSRSPDPPELSFSTNSINPQPSPNPARNRAPRENIHLFFRFLRHHLRVSSTSFVGGFPLSRIGMGFVLRKLVLAFGLLFLTASGSEGVPITFQFTGSVGSVSEHTYLGQDTNGLGVWEHVPVSSSAWFPGSTFSIGESFSGTFTYETTASGTLVPGYAQTDYRFALWKEVKRPINHPWACMMSTQEGTSGISMAGRGP